MEILKNYALPKRFRPVLEICNELEMNLYIEFKCLTKITDGYYENIVENLENESEIEDDDVQFIVRMQNECDIATDTVQEKAEWYYTFAAMRSIENYKKCCNEYDKYINSIRYLEERTKVKMHTIKNMILDLYESYIYNVSYDTVENMIKKLGAAYLYNLDTDFKWICDSECKECTKIKEPNQIKKQNPLDDVLNKIVDTAMNLADKLDKTSKKAKTKKSAT